MVSEMVCPWIVTHAKGKWNHGSCNKLPLSIQASTQAHTFLTDTVLIVIKTDWYIHLARITIFHFEFRKAWLGVASSPLSWKISGRSKCKVKLESLQNQRMTSRFTFVPAVHITSFDVLQTLQAERTHTHTQNTLSLSHTHNHTQKYTHTNWPKTDFFWLFLTWKIKILKQNF